MPLRLNVYFDILVYNLNPILRLVPEGAYRALFKNSKLKLFWPDMGFVFKIFQKNLSTINFGENCRFCILY